MNKLEEICANKRVEVAERKAGMPESDMLALAHDGDPVRGFREAIERHAQNGFALIAEIKKASPSKGLIRADFDPPAHARSYAEGGAACLSVLTDAPYFQGHEDYLRAARAACALPVLRKDFMVDPWQVAESRALGADAILIIMAALSNMQAREIEMAAMEFGMDILIEVHDAEETERALTHMKSTLIGINNRDLKTFRTSLETTENLVRLIPENYRVVGESGINSHTDCQRLSRYGVRSFLVGESLMRQDDVLAATKMLLQGA